MCYKFESLDYFNQIDNAVRCLKNLINSTDDTIADLKKKLENKDAVNWNYYGFRVTKKILSYISQEIEEERAIFLAYDDFSEYLSVRNIEIIWKMARASKNGLLLYGRHYTAKKMKDAGFKPAEISLVLGVSITTVNKLLKSTCLCD